MGMKVWGGCGGGGRRTGGGGGGVEENTEGLDEEQKGIEYLSKHSLISWNQQNRWK